MLALLKWCLFLFYLYIWMYIIWIIYMNELWFILCISLLEAVSSIRNSQPIVLTSPFGSLYSISFFSSLFGFSMSIFSININVANKYLSWLACFMLKINASVSNFVRRFCIECGKEVLCCTTILDNVECWIRLREPKGY